MPIVLSASVYFSLTLFLFVCASVNQLLISEPLNLLDLLSLSLSLSVSQHTLYTIECVALPVLQRCIRPPLSKVAPKRAHFNTFGCRRLRNRPRCRIHPGYHTYPPRTIPFRTVPTAGSGSLRRALARRCSPAGSCCRSQTRIRPAAGPNRPAVVPSHPAGHSSGPTGFHPGSSFRHLRSGRTRHRFRSLRC